MSTVLPANKPDQIQFFEQRIESWIAKADQIGLDALELEPFRQQIEDARNAMNAAFTARDASRDATVDYNATFKKMSDTGRALVATIKAYAERTGDESVYSIASIPPPKPASPTPPPEAPTNVSAILQQDGTIKIEWDGSIANGVTYMVYRRTDAGAGFGPQTLVGSIGARSLIDPGITGCVRTVGYQVRAVRGTQFSPFSAEATIRFTVSGEGAGGQVAQAA